MLSFFTPRPHDFTEILFNLFILKQIVTLFFLEELRGKTRITDVEKESL